MWMLQSYPKKNAASHNIWSIYINNPRDRSNLPNVKDMKHTSVFHPITPKEVDSSQIQTTSIPAVKGACGHGKHDD